MISGIENKEESEQMIDLVLGNLSSNLSPIDLDSSTARYPRRRRKGAPNTAY